MKIYDCTIFKDKPLITNFSKMIMTDRGSQQINYRNGPLYTDIDFNLLTNYINSLEGESKVCYDIEAVGNQDIKIVYKTLLKVIKLSKKLRPDCSFGFYQGGDRFPAYECGDLDQLSEPTLDNYQIRLMNLSDFVAQSIYPRKSISDENPSQADLEYLLKYRIWSWHICSRWKKNKVIPVFTTTLHACSTPSKDFVGTLLISAQLNLSKKFGQCIWWDGADWDYNGNYIGNLSWNLANQYLWIINAYLNSKN